VAATQSENASAALPQGGSEPILTSQKWLIDLFADQDRIRVVWGTYNKTAGAQ